MAQDKSSGVLRAIVSPSPTGRPQARRRPGSHPNLEIDELRESRKSVAIGRLTWAFCDILCECPRGTRLRG